ncbi:MAG: phosphatidylserine decarboxylase family protein [Bacteroidales bacterium]|nr:phosphatidylserine decarboxylase family protein [Bacteroidales bacterium]
MIRFHKEGFSTIIIVVVFLVILNTLFILFLKSMCPIWVSWLLQLGSFFLLFMVLQFFRKPDRKIVENEYVALAPADGEVVVIEETEEPEYFQDRRIQVSIFMSVWNVHSNRWPISGSVTYFQHHDGKYLLANNPKSSTDNEHTTIAVRNNNGQEVMFRQIAGYVARRIVAPVKVGDKASQGQNFGFIKFGSRVDIFFPLGTKIRVNVGDKVKGGLDIIADIEKKKTE